MQRFSAVISVESLASLLGRPDLRVVDCRASLADPPAGRAAYERAHIPGAVFADLLEDLSGPIVPDQTGRHPLPSPEAFVNSLRSFGVSNDSQVVAYDDAGGAFAARLWWMLRWAGHDATAVLDGGMRAWVAAGNAVSRDIPAPVHSGFVPRFRPELLVHVSELLQSRTGKVFDARAPERFRGDEEPIDAVAGHIPGAANLPFAENLEQQYFKSPAVLRARFEVALEGTPPERAIMYCGSGVTACHNVLAFAHAGLPLPQLYAGSWSEWITDPSRPIARS